MSIPCFQFHAIKDYTLYPALTCDWLNEGEGTKTTQPTLRETITTHFFWGLNKDTETSFKVQKLFILLAIIHNIFRKEFHKNTDQKVLYFCLGLTMTEWPHTKLKWIIQPCNRRSQHLYMYFLWDYDYFIGSLWGHFQSAISSLWVDESSLKLLCSLYFSFSSYEVCCNLPLSRNSVWIRR